MCCCCWGGGGGGGWDVVGWRGAKPTPFFLGVDVLMDLDDDVDDDEGEGDCTLAGLPASDWVIMDDDDEMGGDGSDDDELDDDDDDGLMMRLGLCGCRMPPPPPSSLTSLGCVDELINGRGIIITLPWVYLQCLSCLRGILPVSKRGSFNVDDVYTQRRHREKPSPTIKKRNERTTNRIMVRNGERRVKMEKNKNKAH